MQQLTLQLNYPKSYNLDNYIVANFNELAFHSLFAIIENPQKYPFTCIYGPYGSGKTHLLYGISQVKNISYANGHSLPKNIIHWFEEEHKHPVIVVDDADKVKNDQLWYHLYNLAKEHKIALIIASEKPPMLWDIKLADWRSRASTFSTVAIENPDDDTILRIFEKVWFEKGLKINPEISKFLCQRIDRNFFSIHKWANIIDKVSAQSSKSLTKKMITELLERNYQSCSSM